MQRIIVLFSILLLLVPFAALAQDFCEGNFDYDKDVDGTDAFQFKSDFGRSGIYNPCPDDGPAPVERTGQTQCYNENGSWTPCWICIDDVCSHTGQDGDWGKGVTWPDPRFTDNGNGTVTDKLTGLIWLKNANCFGVKIWNQALSDCNGLNSGECGLADGSNAGDWRLPNRKELETLLDFGQLNPSLPSGHPFINVPSDFSDYYWSSTTNMNDAASAWTVHIGRGNVGYGYKNNYNYYVWPVRGGHGLFPSCMEECESELEICLIGCESWSPDSRYICNDNCVFDYSSNCIPACGEGG